MNNAKLGPYTIYFDNSEEYHRLRREVWGSNSYYFETEKENPVIFDAGAHVGVTTLYFKKLFPQGKVIAFEPLPQNIALFKKNMYENQVEGVELVEAALSVSEGEQEYFHDSSSDHWYSTASLTNGAWTGDQKSTRIKVMTKTLSEYLETYSPDFVKMDIEGAEDKVIRQARNSLVRCPHYMIEFHPIEGVGMGNIVKFFEERGFQVIVTKGGTRVPWEKAVGLTMIEAIKK